MASLTDLDSTSEGKSAIRKISPCAMPEARLSHLEHWSLWLGEYLGPQQDQCGSVMANWGYISQCKIWYIIISSACKGLLEHFMQINKLWGALEPWDVVVRRSLFWRGMMHI